MTRSAAGPSYLTAAGQPSGTVRFSWTVAAVCVGFTVAVVAMWYAARGNCWGGTLIVPLLFFCSAIGFFACVWAVRKVPPWSLSRETLVVASSSVLLLSLLWYFGRVGSFQLLFGDVKAAGRLGPIYPFLFFSGSCVAARTILPMLLARSTLGKTPADYGYRFGGTFKLWWLYLLAAMIAVPAVMYASTLPAFSERYPLGKALIVDGRFPLGQFAVYQVAYGLIFASGESFWRGYILFGLERELGGLSVVFMVGLYTLGHLGKPEAEALAALAAGIFLGIAALRHRSFWLGVALHWSIALLMDLLALAQRGVTLT